MKIKSLLGLFAGAVLILSSCASSNQVVGGGIFQKRKYNKGFYWNRGSSSSESASKGKNELIESDQSYLQNSSDEIKGQNPEPALVEVKFNVSSDERNISAKSESVKNENEIFFIHGINQGSFDQAIHPIKKMAQSQSKIIKNSFSKAKTPRNNGQLGNLLGVILLVILLLLLFTVLDALLEGFLSWILRIVILVIIIILLLRLLGVLQ
jgi:hypothetical protein